MHGGPRTSPGLRGRIATLTAPGGEVTQYAYDAQGRVSESAKAGGAERITLAYPAAEQTVVTDSTGSRTVCGMRPAKSS